MNGLNLLRRRGHIATATPIATCVIRFETGAFAPLRGVTERLPDARRREDWRAIGHTLAALHQVQDEQFGLEHHDGFFGPLPQGNRPVSSNRWADYYAERRVTPMLRSAVDSGHLPLDLAADVEHLVDARPGRSGARPSLLHGDAQQTTSSAPRQVRWWWIQHPTSATHPEIDLALIDYFHPVPDEVFDGYREITPIEPSFAERHELWRVFCTALLTVA